MGESSACLVRSFSNPSPTSSEEKKGNPLERALTTSISFGRFMSESLDWEKWSAFTQNRYLEEAEKYSRPGSVAEKKAYFEAHFKRRRAAALLEQQNKRDSYLNMKEEERSKPAERKTLKEDVKAEPLVNPAKSTNHDGCFSDIVSRIEEDKLCKKDDTPPISLASSEKKPKPKPQVSSKWASSVQLKNSDKTPQSKSKAMESSSNKRRSYTTSLHMSINFGADTSKSRIARAPAKKYKNTSTTASANGLFKHHSDKNSRIMRPHGDSISRAPSSKYSKSSNLCGIKTRSPTVPSSFTFKSDERAVKRREKLEQKMKSKEVEKKHTKPQTKATSSDKDLCNSIALETTKNAEFPPRNVTNKVPTRFPKIEERPAAAFKDKDTRPPWRLSVKTERSNAPSYSSKCFTTNKSMNENASPNIQV